jgi:hypothetical protein
VSDRSTGCQCFESFGSVSVEHPASGPSLRRARPLNPVVRRPRAPASSMATLGLPSPYESSWCCAEGPSRISPYRMAVCDTKNRECDTAEHCQPKGHGRPGSLAVVTPEEELADRLSSIPDGLNESQHRECSGRKSGAMAFAKSLRSVTSS